MPLKLGLLATILALHALPADRPAWRRAASGGVQVYSDAGQGMAARVLAETLSFYAACARVRGLDESPPSLKVVYFAREADYRRIRGEGDSRGFFQRSSEADWVVVDAGPDAVRRLRHELVHVMNDRAGWGHVPIWLNEGLAEYYSALDVAAAVQGRVRVMMIESLASQVAVDGGSFGESDMGNRRVGAGQGLFYARAWALVRQLAAHGGESSLNRLASLLRNGTPQTQAFATVYGASIGEMIAQARLGAARIGPPDLWPGRNWPPSQGVHEQAVSESDATRMLDDLARSSATLTEAERRHEAALKKAGLGPDFRSRQAMAEFKRGNLDAALALMEQAAEQGTRDARMWFEYAMLLRESGVERPKWVDALRHALELDPERGEAWFVLGVSTGGYEAVSALERATRALPSKPWVWESYSRTLLETGRRDDARAAAREALRVATAPHERSMAEGLLAGIDAPVPSTSPPRQAVVTPESWTVKPVHAQVEGWLAEVDCLATAPVLIVEGAAGRPIRVSVKRPDVVSARGGEFTCGVQRTKRRVVLGHDGKPDESSRTAGDLLSIEFR
jgi:hypothetical protein